MAWIRKLDSKKWAATIRTPGGKRRTETFLLKGAADKWAAEQEASIQRGDWIDPRHGELTVGEWWERCKDSRTLELASRRRDESHWRTHVEPYWARMPLSAILQPDVSTWTEKMRKAGAGPDTVIGSLKVLRGLLEQAVAAKRIRFNPARGVKAPRAPQSPYRVLEPQEDAVLLGALYDRFPGRPEAGMFVELLLDGGYRWEELAGLRRRNVLMQKQRIHVVDVMERDRTIRPYPKSEAGERDVPVGDAIWPALRKHVMTLAPDDLVFTTQQGKPLDYSRWRSRIWVEVVRVPVRDERGWRVKDDDGVEQWRGLLDGEVPTPHDMRHTYATRLAEQGTPQHELMAILGQKDPRATQRYLHASEDRFDRARKAMDTARKGTKKAADSPATHDLGSVASLHRSDA